MAKKQLTIEEKLQAALVPVEEQPYKVPENWCWSYLENVCQIIMGQSPKGADTTMDDSYTPLIGGAADLGDNAPIINKYTKSVTKLSQCGDLIICIRATLGRPVIADGEYCLGRGVAGCRSSRIDISFLRFFFINFERYLYDNATGSTFAQVTSKVLGKMPIPLPPFLEQSRIVARIESLFAKLDEAKEKIQEVLDGADLRRAAILHQAFTGKLTEKWRTEHGVSIKQWEKKKLKECGKWMGGGTPSMSHAEYWENGDIPWITAKDMKADNIETTQMYTNMLGISNSSANYNDKPSVIFVMRSGILRRKLPIATVKMPYTVNQDLKAVTPEDIDVDYLFWVCESNEKNILRRCMKNGTTVESIDSKALLEFEIPIAPLEEQSIIVDRVVKLIDQEQMANQAAESALTIIDTLKKSILARAFRGELGTNDPSEASAKELLQEILAS